MFVKELEEKAKSLWWLRLMVELRFHKACETSLGKFSAKIWRSSAAFLFFQIFLLEIFSPLASWSGTAQRKLCSYNEVFLPLQTKGKKVLIAFCTAIKKWLRESQPKIEKRSGSAEREWSVLEIRLIFDELAKCYCSLLGKLLYLSPLENGSQLKTSINLCGWNEFHLKVLLISFFFVWPNLCRMFQLWPHSGQSASNNCKHSFVNIVELCLHVSTYCRMRDRPGSTAWAFRTWRFFLFESFNNSMTLD